MQNGKSRHKRSGRQSAFCDLVCRGIRPVMLLVEDRSPHTCEMHRAAIRSNRGPIRKLWVRSGSETKSEYRGSRHRQQPVAAMEPARQDNEREASNAFDLAAHDSLNEGRKGALRHRSAPSSQKVEVDTPLAPKVSTWTVIQGRNQTAVRASRLHHHPRNAATNSRMSKKMDAASKNLTSAISGSTLGVDRCNRTRRDEGWIS